MSRKAIVENVAHLELQLRLRNYRPREEELMLREISKLRHSLPILVEYQSADLQNRQHRSDRVKLVSQRNANFDRLQNLLSRIQNLDEEINRVQADLQVHTSGQFC